MSSTQAQLPGLPVPPTQQGPPTMTVAQTPVLPNSQTKMPLKDFLTRFRSKYPQFKDMSDDKLVESVKSRFPFLASKVDFSSPLSGKASVAKAPESKTPVAKAPEAPMMQASDFLQKFRQKSPAFDDTSDSDLMLGLLAKYPDLNNKLTGIRAVTEPNKLLDSFKGLAQGLNPFGIVGQMYDSLKEGLLGSPEDTARKQKAAELQKQYETAKTPEEKQKIQKEFIDNQTSHTGSLEQIFHSFKSAVEYKPYLMTGLIAGGAVQSVLFDKLPKTPAAGIISDALKAKIATLPGGQKLIDSILTFEEAKPGISRQIGKFSTMLPSSEKRVVKQIAGRQEALDSVTTSIADKAVTSEAAKTDVLKKVQDAAMAVERNRAANGRINTASLESLLFPSGGTDFLDDDLNISASSLGKGISENLSSTDRQYKDAMGLLYNGLSESLDETGAKVSVVDTAKQAINLWAKEGGTFDLNSLDSTAKNVLSKFIPFKRLDKAALDYVQSQLGSKAANLKKVNFFALDAKTRSAILDKFDFNDLPKLNPSQSITYAKYLTNRINSISKASGIPKYVLTSINKTLKESMSSAFEAASPELNSVWEQAQSMSYSRAMRFRDATYRKILDKNNPLSGSKLVTKLIQDPDAAASVMRSIDREVGEDNKLVKTGSKYTNAIRQYASDKLNEIGESNPAKALKALQSGTKGYKAIFGEGTGDAKVYQSLVNHWKDKVSKYESTSEGAYRKFFTQITGTKDPEQIISALSDKNNVGLTDHVLKSLGNDTKTKFDIGSQIYYHLLDKATTNGHFGLPDSVTDPVKYADLMTDAMPQLQKFLRPDQINSLKNVTEVMRNLSLKGGQSTIGVYRTFEYLPLIASGLFMAGGHAYVGSALGSLVVAPPLMMRMMTNPTVSKLLIQGMYLGGDARAIADWAIKLNAAVNVVKQGMNASGSAQILQQQ